MVLKYVMVVGGVMVAAAALLLDLLRPGGGAGIGAQQALGVAGGVLMVVLGLWGRPSLLPEGLARLGRFRSERLSFSRAIKLALLFALAAGLMQASIQAVQSAIGHRWDFVRFDRFWLSPASYVLLFTPVAVALHAAGQTVWSVLGSQRTVLASLLGLSVLGVSLTYATEVSVIPLLILVLGASFQLTRVLERRAEAIHRVAPRAVVGLAAVAVLGGFGSGLATSLSERADLRSLPEPRNGAPNVLLVILDTVRGQSTGVTGYARETTPRLTARAQAGVVFENAYATAPWTLPTHAGIFTGQLPHQLSADRLTPLDETHPTLAEVFGEHGYRTAGFVANQAQTGPQTGLDRGFVHYDAIKISLRELFGASLLVTWTLGLGAEENMLPAEYVDRKRASEVNEEFLSWISRTGDRPYFVFLNYLDAHAPYPPPAPFHTRFANETPPPAPMTSAALPPRLVDRSRNEYDAAIAYLDVQLDRLLAELDRSHGLENTIVIVGSDHGEEFGEHGFFRHGRSLHGPVMQVPLVVLGPGVPGGTRVASPVSVVDIASTALELAGITESPLGGSSLSRHWISAGPGEAPGSVTWLEPVVAEVSGVGEYGEGFPASFGSMVSIIRGSHAYILRGDGHEELYDYRADPWQQRNLAPLAEHQELLVELRGLIPAGFEEYRNRTTRIWNPPASTP